MSSVTAERKEKKQLEMDETDSDLVRELQDEPLGFSLDFIRLRFKSKKKPKLIKRLKNSETQKVLQQEY